MSIWTYECKISCITSGCKLMGIPDMATVMERKQVNSKKR